MAGKLFLIVGPSGSGKDTLIEYVTSRLPVKRVKRYVTRLPNAFEDFISVNACEFNSMDFFIKWGVFDKMYGIGREVLDGLLKGENYVINVSRDVINEVRSKWLDTKVVSLTVAKDVLRARMLARKRDSLDEIEKRLSREFSVPCDLLIDTSNPDITIAGEKLVSYVKGLI